ncbi:helix-turn-helix domain-containing protein [Cutibacterium avidum]|uniref:helix-turn-helix domain-containing protein n=1 Tax=Cutibacterium avidum TaxID=33010 RepID=UPI0003A4F684|nr:helix-turn-helix domain-containing protein [Cutibacterium avidum]MDU5023011.1 helix-turn-helix domain-containing protein [Cutibacterium avidum]
MEPSADRREHAAALRDLGWSNKQIARQLDVHPSTIGRWLTAHTDTAAPDDVSADEMDTTSTSEGLIDQATNHEEKS